MPVFVCRFGRFTILPAIDVQTKPYRPPVLDGPDDLGDATGKQLQPANRSKRWQMRLAITVALLIAAGILSVPSMTIFSLLAILCVVLALHGFLWTWLAFVED